ncbi:NADP-dependent oxidoreductase [Streptomyces natalensis]|uniref:NADPH:quinone reductase n=1 Tax=Streptomyces natalensis ATCC 27448 TaxID=1240678 RepID=A0A0D7CQ43_9ACTN|nr:NADP-dependent oxidoreductase [Streptomyces natalensis]KIZ17532.1 NADPH:quinone reductase [Streptomyces natalensis ATCC 27448]
MRAVIVSEYGGPDVLRVAEVPAPEPGDGQIRIRVAAAALNPADALIRSGALASRVPVQDYYIPGLDVAGTIDALGGGVRGFAVGDAVIGLSDWPDTQAGTHAEYVVLPATAVAAAPRHASPIEAATLPLNGLTAWQALDLLGAADGATVAITGAAGAVGGYLVELAVARGLRTVAVAGPQDEGLVRKFGADIFVPRSEDPTAAIRAAVSGGVDGLIDAAALGGSVIGAVRDGGAFVSVRGAGPGAERGIRISQIQVHSDTVRLAELAALADVGGLTLRVDRTMPFAEAAAAHDALASRGLRGRIVLVP